MMGYDASKVEFTQKEHRAAQSLDEALETFADGFDIGDLGAIGNAVAVFQYLAGDGDRSKIPSRLFTLGVMIERDNNYIDDLVDKA